MVVLVQESMRMSLRADEPKVYKISWLDGGGDSMEFGNTWEGDEVCGDVGMDIWKDTFWDVVGKEVKFEFWDIGVEMICMWFEGVGSDGCMHVGMNVGEREDVVVSV